MTLKAKSFFIEPDEEMYECPICLGTFRFPLTLGKRTYCPICGKQIMMEEEE